MVRRSARAGGEGGLDFHPPQAVPSVPTPSALAPEVQLENARVEAFARVHTRTHTRVTSEISGYLDVPEDVEAETLENGFFYRAVRSAAGNAVYLRARRRADGGREREETVVDMDAVARECAYAMLGIVTLSGDAHQRFVAFTVDRTGDESYTLHVNRVGKRASLVRIRHVVNVVWAPYRPGEAMALYYTQADASKRAYRVCRHVMGTPVAQDEVLLTCSHPRYVVDVNVSKDGQLATAHLNERDSSRVFLLDYAGAPAHRAGQSAQPLVYLRLPGADARTRYHVSHHANALYVVARGAAEDGQRILCAALPTLTWAGTSSSAVPAEVDDALASVHSAAGVATHDLAVSPAASSHSSVIIEDMDMFSRGFVVYGRDNSRPTIEVMPNEGGTARPDLAKAARVPVPHDTCSITPGTNSDYASPVARVTVATPTAPPCEYDVDLASATLTNAVQKSVGVAPGRPLFVAADYVSYQVRAPSVDGARIPITVVHRSDLGIDQRRVQEVSEAACAGADAGADADAARDIAAANVLLDWSREVRAPRASALSALPGWFMGGPAIPEDTFRLQTSTELPGERRIRPDTWENNNPALLHAYGAYGTPLDANFAPERLPLVSRGFVLAFAHVRGGGEFGTRWYHAGRGRSKLTSMRDAVASAHMLITTGLTRASLLAMRTESAGALIGAYMANAHPTLCRAHSMNVPFLDVIHAMSDPSLPLTQLEYVEWGDPRDPDARAGMERFCGVHNVRRQGAYPDILALAADADVRAPAGHALEFVRRVRACAAPSASGAAPLVLCGVHEAAGHFGAGDRDVRLRALALEQTFVLHSLGLSIPVDSWHVL